MGTCTQISKYTNTQIQIQTGEYKIAMPGQLLPAVNTNIWEHVLEYKYKYKQESVKIAQAGQLIPAVNTKYRTQVIVARAGESEQ